MVGLVRETSMTAIDRTTVQGVCVLVRASRAGVVNPFVFLSARRGRVGAGAQLSRYMTPREEGGKGAVRIRRSQGLQVEVYPWDSPPICSPKGGTGGFGAGAPCPLDTVVALVLGGGVGRCGHPRTVVNLLGWWRFAVGWVWGGWGFGWGWGGGMGVGVVRFRFVRSRFVGCVCVCVCSFACVRWFGRLVCFRSFGVVLVWCVFGLFCCLLVLVVGSFLVSRFFVFTGPRLAVQGTETREEESTRVETKEDSLWLGRQMRFEELVGDKSLVFRGFSNGAADVSLLEKSIIEGESPVCHLQFSVYGLPSASHVPRDWSAKWVVNFI